MALFIAGRVSFMILSNAKWADLLKQAPLPSPAAYANYGSIALSLSSLAYA
jgi:hypothetical protein